MAVAKEKSAWARTASVIAAIFNKHPQQPLKKPVHPNEFMPTFEPKKKAEPDLWLSPKEVGEIFRKT